MSAASSTLHYGPGKNLLDGRGKPVCADHYTESKVLLNLQVTLDANGPRYSALSFIVKLYIHTYKGVLSILPALHEIWVNHVKQSYLRK